MTIHVYDSLSRREQPLPAAPAQVGIYVCGPTVYQRIHVGNARPFIVFAWLRNYLREQGYTVTLVSNITDVNDKIYRAAREQGLSSDTLAAQAADWYVADTDALGLGRPDAEPRVSGSIAEIVSLIEELIEAGYAYETGGDVYFRVMKFAAQGQLSRQDYTALNAEDSNPLKKDVRDFALWKQSKPGEDSGWDSPWGRGRPGWHIECSAMAEAHLGREFEIHGGGLDLIFPHHENELAQSKAAGRDFARLWMHTGLLTTGGEKMGKSLGNTQTLRALLDRWGRDTLLVFFLGGHWRRPLEFSGEALTAAAAQVEGFKDVLARAGVAEGGPAWTEFEAALDDDFNTPQALSLMHQWRTLGRTDLLLRALSIFGLDNLATPAEVPNEVTALVEERLAARAAKDWTRADVLRNRIAELGFEVRDVADEPGFELRPLA